MASRNSLAVRARVVGLDHTAYPNDSKLEQKLLWLEKRATTFAGTLATGTLTSDATAQADGDTVLIGSVTYTFKTALTGTQATQTLTSDGTANADGEKVSIEGQTYTFRTTVVAPYDVAIGADAATSLDNLKAAINATGTPGTEYAAGTMAHPLVTATTNTNTTQVVQAKVAGNGVYNQYRVAETGAHLSWGAATLTGGTATIPNQVLLGANAAAMLANLKLAINAGATEGTNYSFGTRAHPQVTATTSTATTQVVQAIDYSVTNASIATTDPIDTGSHMSWGATTLASGVAKVVAVDGTTVNGSAGISGDANV